MVASLSGTGGGVVFVGDLEGNLLARDAASGRVLLKTPIELSLAAAKPDGWP